MNYTVILENSTNKNNYFLSTTILNFIKFLQNSDSGKRPLNAEDSSEAKRRKIDDAQEAEQNGHEEGKGEHRLLLNSTTKTWSIGGKLG